MRTEEQSGTPIPSKQRISYTSPAPQSHSAPFQTPSSPVGFSSPVCKTGKRKIDSEFSSTSLKELYSPISSKNAVRLQDGLDEEEVEKEEEILPPHCATIRAFVEETWDPKDASTSSSSSSTTSTKWNDLCVWGEVWCSDSPILTLRNGKRSLEVAADGLYKIKLCLDKYLHRADEVYLVLNTYDPKVSIERKKECNDETTDAPLPYKLPMLITAKHMLDESIYLSLKSRDRLQLLHVRSGKMEDEIVSQPPWFVSSTKNRDDIYPSLQFTRVL